MPIPKKNDGTLKKLITGIKKLLTLNIGTLIFGVLFIYLLITVFLYITSDRVTSYQVVAGPLTKNQIYTGLILRSEEVITAASPGFTTYYARNTSKVRKTGAVYSVGSEKVSIVDVDLSADDLAQIRSRMAQFAGNFSSDTFSNTYSFKYELEGSILQSAGVSAGADNVSATLGSQTVYSTPSDGVIVYSSDGYEQVGLNNLTSEHFNRMSYHKEDLITDKQIKTGDPVYKLITSENWTVVVPLTDKQAALLAERTSIRVKFIKDQISQVANFSILELEGKKYGQLNFNNGMIRYSSDRFIEMELVTNSNKGLKIPMTSVVSKDFYIIPKDYYIKPENDKEPENTNSEVGFKVEKTNKKGEKTTDFITTTVYEDKDEFLYVDTTVFEKGDILIKSNVGSGQYSIKETKALEGVYSMNKGYAVFRKIIIIDQNEEYCIVETGTPYGIAEFDHIVLNAGSVKEEDILY